MFQIFTARQELRSIAIASNFPFSEWKNTFTDPRLCTAIADRLTYKGHIIDTGDELLPAGRHPSRAAGRMTTLPGG